MQMPVNSSGLQKMGQLDDFHIIVELALWDPYHCEVSPMGPTFIVDLALIGHTIVEIIVPFFHSYFLKMTAKYETDIN